MSKFATLMAVLAVAVLSPAAALAISAPIHVSGTGGLGVNIRPEPNTNRAPLGLVPEGASPDYTCFTYGQNVNGLTVWFEITWGGVHGFISSYYDDSSYRSEEELTSKYGVPKCGAPAPVPTPDPTPIPVAPTPVAPTPQPEPAPTNSQPAGGGGIQGSSTPIQGTGAQSATPAPVSVAGASSGAGAFRNQAIVDEALRSATAGYGGRAGRWGGQCRRFVNVVVAAVSGNRIQLGGEPWDYNQAFRRVGAYSVPNAAAALPGDIVQVGSTERDPRLHTYIVVRNFGNGVFDVVDSNHGYDERVRYYRRTYSGGSIWRVGRV
jgi:hypothetical protein